jgi:hypothetical protein
MQIITLSRAVVVSFGVLSIAPPVHAQTVQPPVHAQTAQRSAAAVQTRIVLINRIPFLCPEAYWGADCSGAGPLGDLHNAALAATVGREPSSSMALRPMTATPTVAAIVDRLQKWSPSSPALAAVLRNSEEMSKITRQLIEHLHAAGMVDSQGQFVQGAFNDPSKFLAYLERSGRISANLAATVRQSLAKNATVAELTKTLDQGRWSGSDVLPAAIMSNMISASVKYWSKGTSPAAIRLGSSQSGQQPYAMRGRPVPAGAPAGSASMKDGAPIAGSPPPPAGAPAASAKDGLIKTDRSFGGIKSYDGPWNVGKGQIYTRDGTGDGGPSNVAGHPGYWDMLGGVLLFETGPGAVVGGYLMSCAAAGEWM